MVLHKQSCTDTGSQASVLPTGKKLYLYSHQSSHSPAKQRSSKADGVTPWLKGLKNHNGFGARELLQVSEAARGDPGYLCNQLCKSRAAHAFGHRDTGSTEPQNSHWLTATHQAAIAILLSPAKRQLSPPTQFLENCLA